MRLFLHIGMAKAGSSTLQTVLPANRKVLQRAGYVYPPGLRGDGTANTAVHEAVLNGNFAWEQDIDRLVGGGESPILSTEFFYALMGRMPDDHLRDFGARLRSRGIALHAILVTRDREPWLLSQYKQHIVNSSAHHARCEDFMAAPDMMAASDHAAYASRFARLVQPSAFLVMPLGDRWLEQTLAWIGLPVTQMTGLDRRTNESLPDVFIEIVRQFNLQKLDPRVHIALRIAVQAVTRSSVGVLQRQARRRAYSQNRRLLLACVDQLAYQSNHPLRYTEAEFDEAVARLRAYYATATASQ